MCLNSWIDLNLTNISVLLLVVRTQDKAKPETSLRKTTFLMGGSGCFC